MAVDSNCGHTDVRSDRADLMGRILYFGDGGTPDEKPHSLLRCNGSNYKGPPAIPVLWRNRSGANPVAAGQRAGILGHAERNGSPVKIAAFPGHAGLEALLHQCG